MPKVSGAMGGLPLCIWTGFLGLESSHGCAHPLLGAHRCFGGSSKFVCRSRPIHYRCGPAQIRACLMYTHSCRAHAFASAGTIQISCCNECAICKSCRPHVRIRSVFTTHPPWQQQLGQSEVLLQHPPAFPSSHLDCPCASGLGSKVGNKFGV